MMMRSKAAKFGLKLGLAVGSLSLALGTASAQGAGQGSGQQGAGQAGTPPSQANPSPSVDASDKELSQFAAAVAELQSIQQSYSQEIGQAGNREKAQEIQKEMQKEMRQAIKGEGLSVKRYSKIGQAAQNDPELRERINKQAQQQ
ncbi:DUF4168 domain-containing protein [Halorhodospira neutriphila]|uniref:DUF4168 domain-containing protein n=1 Tax=Halorhodospira neutriphila TaxID=168379 RepID=A0ABS1E6G5_9GAMM|nr:DUF4168 domain-containing protein [Halorhodospira neutriphila]MBK1725889.1 hypothetical protein [Halorhodospira neutriphila]